MYQWELNRAKANYYQYDSIKPNQFELNINYCSHNGIVQLASSVIDLIWKFFPNSIDKPSSERGEISGPRPIIFDGLQEKHFKVFSPGGQAANHIEFGAEQVIIVRNDETKSRIKKLIGKAGLVMTVFEAKGMEFNDIPLYNFFKDSPAEQKVQCYIFYFKLFHEPFINLLIICTLLSVASNFRKTAFLS